jgi:hypothetical protein
MAKGFTVKAKQPVKQEQEWDYDKAREMLRGKAIVFCMPGRGCSFTFLKNFVQLCFDLVQMGASIQISQDYSSMVNFARCKCLGANVLRDNGGVMNHETGETMTKRKKPFTVDYTGFGWVLIKHGVFENEGMKYPWFAPKMQVFESGEVQDMCGEDVSFCLDAIEAGFEIWCDPRIRVGHEKTRVI